MKNKINILILAAASVFLAGCGGGGSDKPVIPPLSTTSINISISTGSITPSCKSQTAGQTITLTCSKGSGTVGSQILSVKDLDPNTDYTIKPPQTIGNCNLTTTDLSNKKTNSTVSISYTCGGSGNGCTSSPVVAAVMPTVDKGTGNWPSNAVVGYLSAWDNRWTTQANPKTKLVKDAIDNGYNVIIYSFIKQGANNSVTMDGFSKNMTGDNLKAQISYIKKNKGLALASVGGEKNTFTPNANSMADAGNKMANFLHENSFDGLDLDIETIVATQQQMISYITALKKEYQTLTKKDIILTAAPQINGRFPDDSGAQLAVTTGKDLFTTEFLKEAKFDSILVQTYNQGFEGANFFNTGSLTKTGSPINCYYGYPKFLTYTFNLLTGNNCSADISNPTKCLSSYPGTRLPTGTKLTIGVPAWIKASYYTSGRSISATPNCMADATCAGKGISKPSGVNAGIAPIAKHPQFGGVMNWSINYDANTESNWKWVKGITGKK